MLQEFVESIMNEINNQINGIHTALPASIVSFDSSTCLAVVKPILKYTTPTGEKIDYPQISGVPVLVPQGNNQDAVIAYPIKENDFCLLIVSEGALDLWRYSQETETKLNFDLTNSIAIVGLFASPNPLIKEACDSNSIIVKSSNAKVSVGKGVVSLSAPTVNINGNLVVNGQAKVSGELSANGGASVKGNFTTSGGIVRLN